ncbi:hypothetical protein AVDCRST_MAG84-4631, partial [uncultured Microcoleus sp.]
GLRNKKPTNAFKYAAKKFDRRDRAQIYSPGRSDCLKADLFINF